MTGERRTRRGRALLLAAALLLAGLAAACDDSTQDILSKAEGAKTKAALLDALGDPDSVSKLGPIETWTYEASNGEVSFLITGDSVALKSAGGTKKK